MLNKLSECHKMFDKLAKLTNLSKHISRAEFQLKLNYWDDEFCDYMLSLKDKCCKFKVNLLDWSPEVGVWIWRHGLLLRIDQLLDCKITDLHNLYRDCKHQKFRDP